MVLVAHLVRCQESRSLAFLKTILVTHLLTKWHAPNENTYLHGHPPILIRVLALCWTQWFFMQSAKKLIRLGGCPGHWRKKILNIGSEVRGGAGVGRGKQDYCGVTGRPKVTFKIIRGAPCCLPTVPTLMHDYNMHRTGANICTFSRSSCIWSLHCRVDRQNPNSSIVG